MTARFDASARLVGPAELPRVLRAVLARPDGAPADARTIRRFEATLSEVKATWVACEVADRGRIVGACLALLQAGGSALVMPAPTSGTEIAHDAQASALRAVCDAAQARGARFLQALPDPADAALIHLLHARGFLSLTTLRYLERDTRFPWLEPPPATVGAWLSYSASVDALFARALEESYRDSLDCPELNRMRGASDALATHRGAGRFDPSLWNVLMRDGAPAACLLVTALADGSGAEITYLGVGPQHRRQGLGEALVRQALALARRAGLQRIVLAVDARNAPALTLYSRCGFTAYGERVACCLFTDARSPT